MKPESEHNSIGRIVERLAIGAVATQVMLDRMHLEEVAAWSRDLKLAGIDPHAQTARALMPPLLKLSSQEIEINLKCTMTQTTRSGLDLVLGGRIVTTFSEAVYGSEESRSDRMSVEITMVPAANKEISS